MTQDGQENPVLGLPGDREEASSRKVSACNSGLLYRQPLDGANMVRRGMLPQTLLPHKTQNSLVTCQLGLGLALTT